MAVGAPATTCIFQASSGWSKERQMNAPCKCISFSHSHPPKFHTLNNNIKGMMKWENDHLAPIIITDPIKNHQQMLKPVGKILKSNRILTVPKYLFTIQLIAKGKMSLFLGKCGRQHFNQVTEANITCEGTGNTQGIWRQCTEKDHSGVPATGVQPESIHEMLYEIPIPHMTKMLLSGNTKTSWRTLHIQEGQGDTSATHHSGLLLSWRMVLRWSKKIWIRSAG